MNSHCPHYSIRYSETWDAEYCADCGKWLEHCCNEPDCDCAYRPSNAFNEVAEDQNEGERDELDYIVS